MYLPVQRVAGTSDNLDQWSSVYLVIRMMVRASRARSGIRIVAYYRLYVFRRGAFAQHRLRRIAGNEMNERKDERRHPE